MGGWSERDGRLRWDSRGVVGFGTCADREATTADSHWRVRVNLQCRILGMVVILTGWGMLGRQSFRHGVGLVEREGSGVV